MINPFPMLLLLIQDKVEDVPNMNLCQFVCDKLHEELSAGRVSGACLFHLQLLYVDSLDISSLNIDLPDGRFVVNIWNKKNIDIVLNADLKSDGSSFGMLEASLIISLSVVCLIFHLFLFMIILTVLFLVLFPYTS
jgi:hypothetical protein